MDDLNQNICWDNFYSYYGDYTKKCRYEDILDLFKEEFKDLIPEKLFITVHIGNYYTKSIQIAVKIPSIMYGEVTILRLNFQKYGNNLSIQQEVIHGYIERFNVEFSQEELERHIKNIYISLEKTYKLFVTYSTETDPDEYKNIFLHSFYKEHFKALTPSFYNPNSDKEIILYSSFHNYETPEYLWQDDYKFYRDQAYSKRDSGNFGNILRFTERFPDCCGIYSVNLLGNKKDCIEYLENNIDEIIFENDTVGALVIFINRTFYKVYLTGAENEDDYDEDDYDEEDY